jgi:lipopolysaccharide transport system ATP-binding protein
MSPLAIRVEHLSKRYRLGQGKRYYTLRDILAGALTTPIRCWREWQRKGKGTPSSDLGSQSPVSGQWSAADGQSTHIWALHDVSFEIAQGEIVGVIGRNGAGKSTLLKILSRITKPTHGHADVYGHVGSLLEVGTGFHPELSGRENVYLNGAILGMKRAEIARKFDEIVAFAEVERFVDTQVKHYSSGMYMRLAFSVAAHLETDILFVDEVLAVGDAAFQKKCLGKMGTVAKEGRTILFVSHNMTAVQSLCQRSIWLDGGRVMHAGPARTVVSEYLQTTATAFVEQVWSDRGTAPGNEKVKLHNVCIRPENGLRPQQMTVQTPFAIEIGYWNLIPQARLNLSLALYNQEGVCVLSSPSVNEPQWFGRPLPTGLFRSYCHIPGNLLNDGMYRVVVLIVQDAAHVLYCHEDALVFEVGDTVEGRGNWYGKWIGTVRPALEWVTEYIEPLSPSETLTASVAQKDHPAERRERKQAGVIGGGKRGTRG